MNLIKEYCIKATKECPEFIYIPKGYNIIYLYCLTQDKQKIIY